MSRFGHRAQAPRLSSDYRLNPYYKSRVNALGVTFQPIRPDWDLTDPELIRRCENLKKGPAVLYRKLLLLQSSSQVDDRGYFRASGLAAGKYIVCAQMHPEQNHNNEIPSGGKPPVGPVTTCYPSATSIDTATPIDVQSGQELDGIEIRVRSMRTFHIRGAVSGALPAGADREHEN